MMILFRPARMTDLMDIYALAQASGVGITSFSKDLNRLKERLALSVASFQKPVLKAHNELYFFVLEDYLTKKVIGTSAIKAVNGSDEIVYNYQIVNHHNESLMLNTEIEFETLVLRRNHLKCSELCTLYLDPKYRRHHNGMLLSRSRFLFMALHPHRFTRKIIAEMRGFANELGTSPFWDAIGRHFFKQSFAEADKLSSLGNKQFIEDLMPKHPIYIPLLSIEAQAVIGQPHPLTAPAMSILLHEGFSYNGYVDIFDAGPTIAAVRKQIRTIKSCQTGVVKHISLHTQGHHVLLANSSSDFKACVADISISSKNEVTINEATADMLALRLGDSVILSPLQ